jgi:hypothetical protein
LKNIHDIPIQARKSISQIEVFTEYDGRGKSRKAIGQTTRIKLVDKKGALDSLARILGFFQQDRLDTDGIAQLMALVGGNKEGSTIGRISADTGVGRAVLGPVVATQQPVLDSRQGGGGGPLPSQLGAAGVDGKLLVHERHPEGSPAGDDDVSGHTAPR